MPSEVRHLMFKTPEVVQALSSHFRRVGRPLSPGLLGVCTTTGDGVATPVSFQMRIHLDEGTGKSEDVAADDVTLVAALIMHCRDRKIPLPAKATKSLQRIGEQICLVATLS